MALRKASRLVPGTLGLTSLVAMAAGAVVLQSSPAAAATTTFAAIADTYVQDTTPTTN